MASTFAAAVRAFAAKAQHRADETLRRTAAEMLARVVNATPVTEQPVAGAGRARGGWVVTVNGTGGGEAAPDPDGAATVARGEAVIAGAKAGDVVTIQNAVPYIGELEYGHSKQAPAGMVRVADAAFPLIVEQAARKS